MKKILVVIFVCFYSMNSFANDSLSLINKVILCTKVESDFIIMTGFKFLNENQVQYLNKHTNNDNLTEAILEFRTSLNQINIIGNSFHYNHTIYRDTLDIKVGVEETNQLAWEGKFCEVKNPTADNFVRYFKNSFARTLLKAKIKKKI